jgi:hypothetical protein
VNAQGVVFMAGPESKRFVADGEAFGALTDSGARVDYERPCVLPEAELIEAVARGDLDFVVTRGSPFDIVVNSAKRGVSAFSSVACGRLPGASSIISLNVHWLLEVAVALGYIEDGCQIGLPLAGVKIAVEGADHRDGPGQLELFHRKLIDAGARLVSLQDRGSKPEEAMTILSADRLDPQWLRDAFGPYCELLSMDCAEPNESPAMAVFARDRPGLPTMSAFARSFEAVAATPEMSLRRWLC